MSYLPPALQIALAMLAFTAGLLDYRTRRIPNLLVILGLALGLGLNYFLFGAAGLTTGLKGAGLALAIYFPLFALRAMGAGDAKLMAAIGSIVGAGNWLAIFFFTAVLGGVLGIVFALTKKRLTGTFRNIGYILRELFHMRAPYQSREDLAAGHAQALSLPHGAVIAAGSALFLAVIRLAPK
jgi:prepilin peptidase CpaA